MLPTLEGFCAECRQALRGRPLDGALRTIAQRLADLLKQPDFVTESFSPDSPPGKRVLFHDPELDFYVLAHVQAAGQKGKPHDHGSSWAVYGNAAGTTRMTDWRRVNAGDEDHAELEPVKTYDLKPGEAFYFGPHVLHSTEHIEKAWVVRVTGTDLDAIPRYRFRSKVDRILEQA
ncbi:MAG TPA: hypothetical protein VMU56_02415 [Beijerinckiaceae bacterium]|nr:hypothetical protein [Beijerinckiaceae bacterium]